MPSLALSHRAMLGALLDAGRPVYAADLAKIGGIGARHIVVSMSVLRAAIKPHGALLGTYGSYETLRYYVKAADLAPLHAIAAVPEGRHWYQGFSDRDALVLRAIVEAGGRAVPVDDLIAAAYPRRHPYLRGRVAQIVEKIRTRLAARDSAETILYRGAPGALAYAWGQPEEDADEVPLLLDGVTLPSVAGVYRYAAGRLTLDGRPAGRMA